MLTSEREDHYQFQDLTGTAEWSVCLVLLKGVKTHYPTTPVTNAGHEAQTQSTFWPLSANWSVTAALFLHSNHFNIRQDAAAWPH